MSGIDCSKCGVNERNIGGSWCSICINTRKRALRAEKKAKGLPLFGSDANPICNTCGSNKEPNCMNDSLCKTCRSAANKAKRAEKRVERGLPELGSGRSPFCSKCGDKKDDVYATSGYCRKCKLDSKKERTSEKREAAGFGQWGSGDRKIHCCRCGSVKENRKNGYCNECSNALERELYRKKYDSPEAVELRRQKVNKKYADDLLFNLKRRSHGQVHRAISKGLLIKQPCEVCGIDENVDAHHDDYMKPLDVRWLCRKHHVEHHENSDED